MKNAYTKNERAFSFIKTNDREQKARQRGITEIRRPYYSPMGKNYLNDLLSTMGDYINSVKFAGGSFTLMHANVLKEFIEICHSHQVLVSTGGFIEYALIQGKSAVDSYIDECRDFGFDILEISSGFVTISPVDVVRLIEKVKKKG